MKPELRVGVAGLGTVGASLVRQLQSKADLLAQRCGRPIVVTGVSARDRTRDRGVDVSGIQWFDNATDLARFEGIDVFVELIGGDSGPADESVRLVEGDEEAQVHLEGRALPLVHLRPLGARRRKIKLRPRDEQARLQPRHLEAAHARRERARREQGVPYRRPLLGGEPELVAEIAEEPRPRDPNRARDGLVVREGERLELRQIGDPGAEGEQR